jgi:hypothetical protein
MRKKLVLSAIAIAVIGSSGLMWLYRNSYSENRLIGEWTCTTPDSPSFHPLHPNGTFRFYPNKQWEYNGDGGYQETGEWMKSSQGPQLSVTKVYVPGGYGWADTDATLSWHIEHISSTDLTVREVEVQFHEKTFDDDPSGRPLMTCSSTGH